MKRTWPAGVFVRLSRRPATASEHGHGCDDHQSRESQQESLRIDGVIELGGTDGSDGAEQPEDEPGSPSNSSSASMADGTRQARDPDDDQ